MKTLEEITYEAGRHALAEQESAVAGIRQRTGTLLAAHVQRGAPPRTMATEFVVDTKELYERLQALAAAEPDSLTWLVTAGFGYEALRQRNAAAVRWMSRLSGLLAALLMAEAVCWLGSLRVDW